MPEIMEEQSQGEEEKKKESKAVVGIIYPPPEVRSIHYSITRTHSTHPLIVIINNDSNQ